MIIDKSHWRWVGGTLALFVALTCVYIAYATSSADGVRGGSRVGLGFGTLGSALMIFAGLLAARKKVPRWQVGTAEAWLKGHIWLGLLSVPCILFHSGFRWGGALEQLLMAVFALVVLSGMVGLAIQGYLPGLMKTSVPAQAIYEQIPRVCQGLRRAADAAVVSACGSLFETPIAGSGAGTAVASSGGAGAPFDPTAELKRFYLRSVRPFLHPDRLRESDLASTSRAAAKFAQLREAMPEELHPVLEELGGICEERRQLALQARIHHWLHGWLVVHVPLSLALLILGVAHAVMSVYY